MEPEENLPPLVDLYLDGSAMSSQVVEIIGGITLAAVRSPETAAASLEEGDDEVFYEDEEAMPHRRGGSSGYTNMPAQPQSGDMCLSNERDAVRDVSDGADSLTSAHTDESGPPPLPSDTAQECQKRLTATNTASTPALDSAPSQADPQTTRPLSLVETQTPTEQVSLAEEGKQREGVTPQQEQTYLPEEGPGQVNSQTEDQVSEESQDELEQDLTAVPEAQQSQDTLYLRATRSLGRKSEHNIAHKKSFNHHTHSKYGTVSYRKIRRGNTRQKIEEFECMMMNI